MAPVSQPSVSSNSLRMSGLPPGVLEVTQHNDQQVVTVRFSREVNGILSLHYAFPYSALAGTPASTLEEFLLLEVPEYRRWRGIEVEFEAVQGFGEQEPQRVPMWIAPRQSSQPSLTVQRSGTAVGSPAYTTGVGRRPSVLDQAIQLGVVRTADLVPGRDPAGSPPGAAPRSAGRSPDPWPPPAPGPRRIRLEDEVSGQGGGS